MFVWVVVGGFLGCVGAPEGEYEPGYSTSKREDFAISLWQGGYRAKRGGRILANPATQEWERRGRENRWR